ncbi:MAG TPA: putative cytokinetic ring protein SteA, partial [Micromonosporaceae bacterium]|nr:putative cytokinetic ring protein SteA [Micromonosporaceae bacterium]
MRLPTLRRTRSAEPGMITGTARLDRRTKRLVGRLRPGDIAVIDHVDLDRVAADSLVAVGVAAVLNAKPSISGRYPNLGPEVLIQAGIPLLDDLGEALFQQLREGDTVRVEGNTVFRGGEPVAMGERQDPESVAKAMADAREGLSVQLEAFAANTMEYLKQERDL